MEPESMPYYDNLRDYLTALDALGDVMHIHREVDGDLEPGAITRRSYEIRSPAPLFENIRGVAPGFRILGAPAALCSRPDMPYARVALSLGLPAQSTGPAIVNALAATRRVPYIKPVRVEVGHALSQQHVLRGEQATLDRFPIPFAHDHDGGRYANTWGTLIVKTPDGRWVNWSIARVMKVDGKRMVGLMVPSQHIGQIWGEWVALGKPMPYALVQGPAPAISCLSGMPLPAEVDEADFVGALAGEPVKLVKAISVDLDVPASAEIVIKGMSPSNATAWKALTASMVGTWAPALPPSRPSMSRPSPTAKIRSGRWWSPGGPRTSRTPSGRSASPPTP
jgi:4-hydroxy-3-polyprenylbenzoate decarboxylase